MTGIAQNLSMLCVAIRKVEKRDEKGSGRGSIKRPADNSFSSPRSRFALSSLGGTHPMNELKCPHSV